MKKTFSFLLALLFVFGALSFAAAESEPVHVVFICPSSGSESDAAAYKLVQDYILQETGVLVDSIRLSGTNDSDKINAMLSGGEQIDVFWGNWMTYEAIGAIQPLTPYLDLVPNLVRVWTDFNEDAFAVYTDADGEVWGFPRNVNRVFYQTFVRQDWLDALNMAGPGSCISQSLLSSEKIASKIPRSFQVLKRS